MYMIFWSYMPSSSTSLMSFLKKITCWVQSVLTMCTWMWDHSSEHGQCTNSGHTPTTITAKWLSSLFCKVRSRTVIQRNPDSKNKQTKKPQKTPSPSNHLPIAPQLWVWGLMSLSPSIPDADFTLCFWDGNNFLWWNAYCLTQRYTCAFEVWKDGNDYSCVTYFHPDLAQASSFNLARREQLSEVEEENLFLSRHCNF